LINTNPAFSLFLFAAISSKFPTLDFSYSSELRNIPEFLSEYSKKVFILIGGLSISLLFTTTICLSEQNLDKLPLLELLPIDIAF